MELDNKTPFVVDRYGVQDKEGADLLALVVKGTFSFNLRQDIEIADEQQPLEVADRYYGKPDVSSIEYASDFAVEKAGTDIALIGHAYATREAVVEVGLHVGIARKNMVVFGDRHWIDNWGIPKISKPLPFDRMPIKYEHAFGGVDKSNPDPNLHAWEAKNPVGVGFRARKSKKPIEGERLPNLEDPINLIQTPDDHPDPVGLGFIAPFWQPRLGFAGTYDAEWEENRSPLLPEDFDARFFNAAHPRLIYPGFLKGGEGVYARGVSTGGDLRFNVPQCTNWCTVVDKEHDETLELSINKFVLEPDESRCILVWSGVYRPQREFVDVKSLTFEFS